MPEHLSYPPLKSLEGYILTCLYMLFTHIQCSATTHEISGVSSPKPTRLRGAQGDQEGKVGHCEIHLRAFLLKVRQHVLQLLLACFAQMWP